MLYLWKMKGVIALLRYCVIGSKTKDWLLCILSAILLILSFPKFNLWILAWFAFIPLLFAVWNKTSVKAFLLCYFTGIIFWFGIIYWLIHVTTLGLILLILYLSLYFGIFGLIISLTHLHTYTLTLCFLCMGFIGVSAQSSVYWFPLGIIGLLAISELAGYTDSRCYRSLGRFVFGDDDECVFL